MPHLSSTESLRRFLLTEQLLSVRDWESVADEAVSCAAPSELLDLLERRQLLTPLQIGRIRKGETEGLVLGGYKLLYRNASGSFARVFRATRIADNQTVALKLLRDRWCDDPTTVSGFHREAEICRMFVHPNIVPILDVGRDGRFHFFTMEFVEGGNLREFLNVRKKLEPLEATRCLIDICEGLEYALSMGATHRDLKLTNVLMSSSGVAKLVDFGLAGAETPGQAGSSDGVQRALEYAALERGTNAPRDDPRSDIFFAGAIYYELLSGVVPWPRTRDREERRQLSRYTNVTELSVSHPQLPKRAVEICSRMMEVSPSARYQNYAEVVRALKAVRNELGGAADEGTTEGKQVPSGPFRLAVVDANRRRREMLQTYFGRHGFELTFLDDPDAGLRCLKGASLPDGLLFLADDNPAPVCSVFPEVQAYSRSKKVLSAAVFSGDHKEEISRLLTSTRSGTTFFQPTTLRDLRNHFQGVTAK